MKLTTYDGELDICGSNFCSKFVNVFNPSLVIVNVIGRDANHLNITFGKVTCATSDFTEFGGADRGEISWMREEDGLKAVR